MRIDFNRIPKRECEAMRVIAECVRAAGGRAMLVGGAVRDLVRGDVEVKDADVEVFGLTGEQLMKTIGAHFAFDTCGVSFGILKLKHLDIDVATPRRESKCGTGHKGFIIDADPTMTIADAARRRDFTINALYADILTGEVEDPYGGLEDLKDGVLRHVSEQFAEDPLRVLRGMQFAARFNLTPARETIALCRKMTIEGLPPERLFGEWAKLLTKGHTISRGLTFLRETGWVRYFPELARLIGCKQDCEWHPEGDVWNHTLLCLDAFARRRLGNEDEDLIVGLAVLCHDFGKPATTFFDRKKNRLRSLGHDAAGVEPTLAFLKRLTNEERLLREVPPLVQYHMQPFSLWKAKAKENAIRRLAVRVGRIDRLLRVSRADEEGRGGKWAHGKESDDLAWLATEAERLRIADAAPKPILQGRHLIALGYSPSPQFGVWLKAAFDAQLEGAFSDETGAIEYFKRFLRISRS